MLPKPQLTLASPRERRSAACCRGWEHRCTRPGSQRNRLLSDSVSPRPEQKEGSLGVGRGGSPKTHACTVGQSSPTGGPLTPQLGTPGICGSRRPKSCQGSAPGWRGLLLRAWVLSSPPGVSLEGSSLCLSGNRPMTGLPTEGTEEGTGDVCGLGLGLLYPRIPCGDGVPGPE